MGEARRRKALKDASPVRTVIATRESEWDFYRDGPTHVAIDLFSEGTDRWRDAICAIWPVYGPEESLASSFADCSSLRAIDGAFVVSKADLTTHALFVDDKEVPPVRPADLDAAFAALAERGFITVHEDIVTLVDPTIVAYNETSDELSRQP